MSASKNDLKGQRAVITGASSGIGAEYARQLAAEGVHLVLVARRKEKMAALAEELQEKHAVDVEVVAADLLKPESLKTLFEAATSNGKTVEILINNAGMGDYAPFLDKEIDDHLNTIQLNMATTVELTHRFARHMRDHGKPSSITNVASVAAFVSTPNFAVYGASKQFLLNFSETLDYELRNTAIRVTCVCPGGTYTDFLDHAGQKLTKAGHQVMMTSEEVVRIGIRGIKKQEPVVVTGMLNKLAAFFPRFVPRRMAISMTERAMQRSVQR